MTLEFFLLLLNDFDMLIEFCTVKMLGQQRW